MNTSKLLLESEWKVYDIIINIFQCYGLPIDDELKSQIMKSSKKIYEWEMLDKIPRINPHEWRLRTPSLYGKPRCITITVERKKMMRRSQG